MKGKKKIKFCECASHKPCVDQPKRVDIALGMANEETNHEKEGVKRPKPTFIPGFSIAMGYPKPGILINYNRAFITDQIKRILERDMGLKVQQIAKRVNISYTHCQSIIKTTFGLLTRSEEAREFEKIEKTTSLEEEAARQSSHPSNPNRCLLEDRIAMRMQFYNSKRLKLKTKIKTIKSTKASQTFDESFNALMRKQNKTVTCECLKKGPHEGEH